MITNERELIICDLAKCSMFFFFFEIILGFILRPNFFNTQPEFKENRARNGNKGETLHSQQI